MSGALVISLDFELFWGVFDSKSQDNYAENVLGAYVAIPKMIDLFEAFGVKATFSTVGFIFFRDVDHLLKEGIPKKLPNYQNKKFSAYEYLKKITNSDRDKKLHFAPNLIERLKKSNLIELGTHTMSHYYCLEAGQDIEEFEADIEMAICTGVKEGISVTSLVFPRNQFNKDYLDMCYEKGIICYRGTEKSWLYRARSSQKESLMRRLLRLIDSYINISGNNSYNWNTLKSNSIVNIPSSRFFRPYSKKGKHLEFLKLKRIKDEMLYAAKNGLIYHLWWHPHNFGINQDENLQQLKEVLSYYAKLKSEYNFCTYGMSECAQRLKDE